MFRAPLTLGCIVLLCLMGLPAAPALSSDAIHKCRGRDGQSYYQATPCASTHRTEWVRDFPVAPSVTPPATASTSVPAPRVAPAERRPHQSARSNTRRRQGSPQGAVISMHRDAVGCDRAKKARDQAYARLGLKRDFATSRKLDDRVNAACR